MKFLRDQFGLSTYSIAGLVLVAPFIALSLFDLVFRQILGNQQIMQTFYGSIFHSSRVLLTIVIILPAMAAALNLIPFIKNSSQAKWRIFNVRFLRHNLASLGIIAVMFAALNLLFGHDVLPCIGRHLLQDGPLNLPSILPTCRNA